MQQEDSIAVLRYVMASDTATEDHPYFIIKCNKDGQLVLGCINEDVNCER